jgi:hypothetical protein
MGWLGPGQLYTCATMLVGRWRRSYYVHAVVANIVRCCCDKRGGQRG